MSSHNRSPEGKTAQCSCEHCGKEFSRRDALTRHTAQGKCTNATVNMEYSKESVNVMGDHNETNVNSKNVYINLIVFTKDGIQNISPKDLAEILRSSESVIGGILSNVNLNPEKPQHHNILYGDSKSAYGEVYENGQWAKNKISEILDMIIDAKITDLNDILNDMNDFLDKKTRRKIEKAIEKAEYNNPEERKKLKSYLKNLLYERKDLIIKTRKITEEEAREILRKEYEEASREAELAQLKKDKAKRKRAKVECC